jgi:REP element-mobilizing transposase RayT
MARMRRSFEQHGWFHITNRGVDKQDIYTDDDDRSYFVEQLGVAALRHGVEVHAFSLMSNHFHLIVHSPDGELSDFMQHLLQRYAIRHNWRVGRVGHLFSGRFRSTVIHDVGEAQELTTVLQVMARYVHRNPLERSSIGELRRDRFSSYGVYLGLQPGLAWLCTDRLLGSHDDDREQLADFTERHHPTDKIPALGRHVVPYSPEAVLSAVSGLSGISMVALTSNGARVANPWRDLTAHLCVRLRTSETATLAALFGLASPAGFRRLAARGKDRCGIDQLHSLRRDSVMELLWQNHCASLRDVAA